MAIELEMPGMTEEDVLEMSAEMAEEMIAVNEPSEGEEGDADAEEEEAADPDATETIEDNAEEEWPDETVTTTDASPDDDGADLLAQISNAERECKRAEYVVMERKEDLKAAKEEFDGCVTKLRKLAAQVVADANRPLFSQVKVMVKKAALPLTEATDVAPDAGEVTSTADDLLPLPPPEPSTLWRANSIDVLGLTPSLTESLRRGDIATLGELADLIERCKHGDYWPKGIGKQKRTTVTTALFNWQKDNLETASQDVPVTIPAWDSLSVDEQGAYIESRAKRLEGKTCEELDAKYAIDSAPRSMHDIFNEGVEAEAMGDKIINCPCSPTPEGNWDKVDAWLAGWTYNSRRLDSNDPECGME